MNVQCGVMNIKSHDRHMINSAWVLVSACPASLVAPPPRSRCPPPPLPRPLQSQTVPLAPCLVALVAAAPPTRYCPLLPPPLPLPSHDCSPQVAQVQPTQHNSQCPDSPAKPSHSLTTWTVSLLISVLTEGRASLANSSCPGDWTVITWHYIHHLPHSITTYL